VIGMFFAHALPTLVLACTVLTQELWFTHGTTALPSSVHAKQLGSTNVALRTNSGVCAMQVRYANGAAPSTALMMTQCLQGHLDILRFIFSILNAYNCAHHRRAGWCCNNSSASNHNGGANHRIYNNRTTVAAYRFTRNNWDLYCCR
jgi:hypothetical protein